MILMCGPAGSGKSTYAKRLEQLGMVRDRRGEHADDIVLTEELAARYFDHFEVPAEAGGAAHPRQPG